MRPPFHPALPYSALHSHPIHPFPPATAASSFAFVPPLSSASSPPLFPSPSPVPSPASLPLPVSSFVVDRRVYSLDQRPSRGRSDSLGAGSGAATPPQSSPSSAAPFPAAGQYPPPSALSLQAGQGSVGARMTPPLSASALPSLPSLQSLQASLSSIAPPYLVSPRTWWNSLSALSSRWWSASSAPTGSSAVPSSTSASFPSPYSSYSYYPVAPSSPLPSSSVVLSPIQDGDEEGFRSDESSASTDSGDEEGDSSGWEGESDSLSSSEGEAFDDDGRSSAQQQRHERRRERRQRKQRSKAQRLSPFWALCGCPQPCFVPSSLPSASAVYRAAQRSGSRCWSWLRSPERWCAGWSSSAAVKALVARYKELPSSTREKALFLLSSTLGTVLFFFLFESFMIVLTTDLDVVEGAFTLSYLLAYVISIAWQHALHRLLVFSHQPYCLSLLHTYASYSFSLLCFAALGALLIQAMRWPPRLVAAITLPCSAVANYYLLTRLARWSERWEDAREREEPRRSLLGSAASGLSSTSSGSAANTPTLSASDDGGFASSHPSTAAFASQSSPRRGALLQPPPLPPFFASAYTAMLAATSSSNSRPPSPFTASSSASAVHSPSPFFVPLPASGLALQSSPSSRSTSPLPPRPLYLHPLTR